MSNSSTRERHLSGRGRFSRRPWPFRFRFPVLTVVAAFTLCAHTPARSQSREQLLDTTIKEIQKIEAEKAQRNVSQQKISSHLLDAIKRQKDPSASENAPKVRVEEVPTNQKGSLIDIKAQVTPSLLKTIRQSGGTIVGYYEEENTIRARIPLDRIEELAKLPAIKSLAPAAVPTRNASPFVIEGRIAHGVDHAVKTFKVDGKGIRIGVISDSIDDNNKKALARAYKLGALSKSALKTLPGWEGESGTAEGLAMAQIIHAIAPRATIYFATGWGGQASMARAIRELRKAGCQIIVDDLTYPDESPFQDGPIAKAVSEVSDAGVLYFSSARNAGNMQSKTSGTWEGDFDDGGVAINTLGGEAESSRMHAFVSGRSVNKILTWGSDGRINLFWAEPFGAATADYNLYLIDANGRVLTSGTTNHDNSTKNPYQFVWHENGGEAIVITKPAGAPSLFMHLDTGDGRLEFATNGSVRGHNASGAANAFSVAASRISTPPKEFSAGSGVAIESFSADGPRRMFFKPDGTPFSPGEAKAKGGIVLDKPDIAAANGVSTTLPKTTKMNPFVGTSAAAPHAAAIAALLLSYEKKLTPAEVRQALTSSLIKMEAGQAGESTGPGIVMAFGALAAACSMKRTECPASPTLTAKK